MRIEAIGASSGIAIGKAFVLPSWEWESTDEPLQVSDLARELERLYESIRSSKIELTTMKRELSEVIGREESNIFDAHLAILDDPLFMNEVQGIIRRQYKAAEVAVKEAIDKFAAMFDLLEDEYMKERALDIKDVGNRLIKHLIGAPEVRLPEDTQPFILVARELTPSQLIHLNPNHVHGIVTMIGGKTSHSAIMARALGIPSVVGVEGKLFRPIQTGDLLIVDGDEGTLYVMPSEEEIREHEERQRQRKRRDEQLKKLIGLPAMTKDGIPFHLGVNLNSVKEAEKAMEYGISGVGLLRTEFLYMDRSNFPGEEEQFEAYKSVAVKLQGKPLVIRTLDIGGDKKLDYFELPEEDNPFLGYRAIRISLDRTDLFKTQLRAILRASHYGNIRLLHPMISSVEELRRANRLLEECKEELRREGHPFNPNIEVGVNIEVPAAAAIADLLAREADFFSIGTNDLVQYVLAVDRMNEHIASYYDPCHPAVIRLLKQTADAAHAAGIPVSVCGEIAGDVLFLPIWIGLGIYDLSMSVQSVLPIKQHLLHTDAEACRQLFRSIIQCSTSQEIHELLKQSEELTCC